MSHDGRHVAWVDIVTGSKPTIIVSDADGTNPKRLKLPAGTWFAWLGWSSDDQTILATALVQLKKAVGTIVLIETERGDPGPLATHLLTVPLDGSPSVDLVDDADTVAAGLKSPGPTARVDRPAEGDQASSESSTRLVGRPTVPPSHTSRECWTDRTARNYHDWKTACLSRLMTVDVATRATHVILDDMADIATLAWAPSGREIAFRGSDRAGHVGIYVYIASPEPRTW